MLPNEAAEAPTLNDNAAATPTPDIDGAWEHGDVEAAAVIGETAGGGSHKYSATWMTAMMATTPTKEGRHERHDKQMSRPVTWVDTAGLLDWNGRLT